MFETPEEIKKFRADRDLSQRELGELIGYSEPQQRVYELEAGKKKITPRVSAAIAMIEVALKAGKSKTKLLAMSEHLSGRKKKA